MPILTPAGSDWTCAASPIAVRESSRCWVRWLPTTVKRLVCRELSCTTPDEAREGALICWVSIGKVTLPRWSGPRRPRLEEHAGPPVRRNPRRMGALRDVRRRKLTADARPDPGTGSGAGHRVSVYQFGESRSPYSRLSSGRSDVPLISQPSESPAKEQPSMSSRTLCCHVVESPGS